MELLAQKGGKISLKIGAPINDDEEIIIGYGLKIGSISSKTGTSQMNAQA